MEGFKNNTSTGYQHFSNRHLRIAKRHNGPRKLSHIGTQTDVEKTESLFSHSDYSERDEIATPANSTSTERELATPTIGTSEQELPLATNTEPEEAASITNTIDWEEVTRVATPSAATTENEDDEGA